MSVTERIIDYFRGKGVGAETIRYIIVGVLTTLLSYGIFELMWGHLGIDETVSNVTSIAVAIVFAYIMNKLVVFRRHSDSMTALAIEFGKFVGSRLLTMGIEVGGVALFHSILGYNARLSKIGSQVVVIVTNYVLSKLIVFRGDSGSGRQDGPERGSDGDDA